MTFKTMEGSQGISETAARCDPDVVACYPITPSVHIAEELNKMYVQGKIRNYIAVESEFAALSVLIGASAAGGRTFSATSSQGLALMHEPLFAAAGMRLPVVMAIGNRAISAPLNIWNDHSDTMAERDSGCVQFYAVNNQEACTTLPLMFKLCEKHLLPGMVCIDGYYLTHTYEQIELPKKEAIENFLPDFRPEIKLDPENPLSLGVYAGPEAYQDFREDIAKTHELILKDFDPTRKKWENEVGETFGAVHPYQMEDAEKVIVGMGSIMGSVNHVIQKLRKKGQKVGSLTVRLFRPFPRKKITELLKGKQIAVIDRAASLGSTPPLFTEVAMATRSECSSFIAGLGGRTISLDSVENMFTTMEKPQEVWINK